MKLYRELYRRAVAPLSRVCDGLPTHPTLMGSVRVRWSSASIIADVEISLNRKIGPGNDLKKDRRPEPYGKILRK